MNGCSICPKINYHSLGELTNLTFKFGVRCNFNAGVWILAMSTLKYLYLCNANFPSTFVWKLLTEAYVAGWRGQIKVLVVSYTLTKLSQINIKLGLTKRDREIRVQNVLWTLVSTASKQNE